MKLSSYLPSKNILSLIPYVILLLIFSFVFSSPVFSQGGRYDNVTFRGNVGIGGVNVAVCQPLATTAASVTANIATYTMSSNPQTAGFVAGMQIQTLGFTGADTYFNTGTIVNNALTGGQIILSVTPTTINTTLIHANASAASNGTILQMGNSTTPCAGLSILYTDATLGTISSNPIVSDGFGNYGFWAPSGNYSVQFYGPTVTTTLRYATIAAASVFPGTVNSNQIVYGNGPNSLASTPNFTWVQGSQASSYTSTTAATGGANQPSPTLSFISNYWNGAASAADTFTCQAVPPAGTNPIINFVCTHSGSPGGFSVDFSNLGNTRVSCLNLLNIVASVSDIICPSQAGGINQVNLPSANPINNNMFMGISSGNPIGLSFRNAPWSSTPVDLTGQNAAITGPVVLTSPLIFAGATQYCLDWNAKVTTVASTGAATSTLGPLTINWVDPDGVSQSTVAPATSRTGAIETSDNGNTTTTTLQGLQILLNSNNGSNTITYTFGYASNTANQMVYNLHIKIWACQ